MKATKTSIRRYRDSLKKLNIRKRQLKDAKLAYLRAKRHADAPHADAPQFFTSLKQKAGDKIKEIKERKRIWNEAYAKWDRLVPIVKEIEKIVEIIDDDIDEQIPSNYYRHVNQLEQIVRQMKAAKGLQHIPVGWLKTPVDM